MFVGNLIEGHPPLYIGIYVNDFAYFSASDKVEKKFETDFGSKIKTKFNRVVDYYLGIKITNKTHPDNSLTCYLSQTAFIDQLVSQCKLDGHSVNMPKTPYQSGPLVNKIKPKTYDQATQNKLKAKMQSIIGSLTWLSTSTRPDIATIRNILAKYINQPSKGHIDAAKKVIRYLQGTRKYGIAFTSSNTSKIESFVKFPLKPRPITALTDANWGPQDQSKVKPGQTPPEMALFKSPSISGYIIWYGGPIHWISKV